MIAFNVTGLALVTCPVCPVLAETVTWLNLGKDWSQTGREHWPPG